jgi:UDP-glucuronate 4-epimerase
MRYLVTGAAGFIGSHLVEALRSRGHDTVAADVFSDYYDPALKEENAREFEVLRIDLASAPLEELVASCDGIFHLAGQPGVRSSWGEDFSRYLRDNVLATQRLFEAAVPAKRRVVFASSSSVYGDAESYPTPEETTPSPISPYGVTKLACEHLARAYGRNSGLDAVVLRYFTVFGPRQRPDMFFTRLLTALAEGSEVELYGDGSQSRSFTYVGDVVEATLLAMERGREGAVYNVGGGVEASVRETIELAERVSGLTLAIREREPAAGDVKRTAPEISRAREDLGWTPGVSLEEGLRRQWDWLSARRAA